MILNTLLTLYLLSGTPVGYEPPISIDGQRSINETMIVSDTTHQTRFEHILGPYVTSEGKMFEEMTGGIMSAHLGSGMEKSIYRITVPKGHYLEKIANELSSLTGEKRTTIEKRLKELNTTQIKEDGNYIQSGALVWYVIGDNQKTNNYNNIIQ